MTNQPSNCPENKEAPNTPANNGEIFSPEVSESAPEKTHVYRAENSPKNTEKSLKKAKQPGKLKRRWRALKKWKRVCITVLCVLLALCLVLAGAVAALIQTGKSALFSGYSELKMQTASENTASAAEDGKTVIYNGSKYVFNEDVTSVLFMGIDKTDIHKTGAIGENGQADAIFILAIDTKTGKTTVIPVVRDTLADVDVYSAGGSYIGSQKEQVCLAYAYGDGAALSCENTAKSVSRLYYGLPINSYAAIDLKALEVLTEKVGGVEVESLETFKMSRRTVVQGQKLTLKGIDAIDYIQMRDKSTVDSSLMRLKRQQQFIMAFCDKAVAATKKDITVPVKMYQSVTEYMVTDIDLSKVSYFASLVVGGTDFSVNMKTTAGNMQMGEEFAEYRLDEKAAYQTVLDVFYKQVPAE